MLTQTYRKYLAEADLDGDERAGIEADLATVREQAASDKPDESRVRTVLKRIGKGIAAAVGAGATAAITGRNLLNQLPAGGAAAKLGVDRAPAGGGSCEGGERGPSRTSCQRHGVPPEPLPFRTRNVLG